MHDLLNGSAFGFLEQACKELSEGRAFDSEAAFKQCVSENMLAIVERASEMNAGMLKKASTPAGERVKRIIAIKVWEAVNVNALRQRTLVEYEAVLKD
jgi:hypothetical protein